MDIASISCPVCGLAVELVNHIFFACQERFFIRCVTGGILFLRSLLVMRIGDLELPQQEHLWSVYSLRRRSLFEDMESRIHYVKDADSDICEEIELSDGTFNYKPIVDESEKPKIGSEYSTIDKCIEMYAKYAEKSGFTIRKSTQEKLKSGIPARYVLYEFEEAHNHTFVPKAYRNLTKKRKQMSHPEQIFVQQLGSTSIGPTRAHHLYASTHGTIWSLYLSLALTITESVSPLVLNSGKEEIAIDFVYIDPHTGFVCGYITNKLLLKICSKVLDNGTFRRRLHHLVWSLYIDPDEFEKKWHLLIEEFDLKENKWLSDMYNIRNRWIPAYFKDVELCGLMRTTSRSESENSFFSNFTSGGSTLINFMMCFEAAMERQRHRQEILDDSTMQKIPRFKTKLPIERYAQKKYTKTMFTLIQEEINSAVYDCHQISESLENGIETVTIKEIREIKVNTSRKKYNFGETSVQNKRNQTKKELRFKVSTDKSDGSVICSCMNFARFGFLCRHIFCVLKGNGVEVIPDKYILKRWKRDILPPHIRRKRQMFGFEGGRYMECSATVYSAVEYCLNLLAKDEGKLIEFVENVKRLKTEVEEANPNAKQLSKKEMFNLVLGVEKPEVNTVKNPEPCSNKGNASGGQRKKSEIEKLREHMKKHRRLCKKCVKYRRHDSRNCTKKPDEIPTDSDSTVVSD
ncbi:FAR1-related sequence 5-like protein [Tanacetum coccineum]|uniref:FAR1-related sequence 5-like protein n=1 Tax=Tanacetum coccineum TaxID=301880 RepID=A0ABQ5D719_9ASTR